MVGVRLRGGATRKLDICSAGCPASGQAPRRLIVAEIGELLLDHTDAQVADILNRRGRPGSSGQPFNTCMVAHVRFRRLPRNPTPGTAKERNADDRGARPTAIHQP